MSIDNGFRKMMDGIKQADEGRDEVMRGLGEAWAGRMDLDGQVKGLEAQTHDLKETVDELKRLVMDQGAELRGMKGAIKTVSAGLESLRDRLEGGR